MHRSKRRPKPALGKIDAQAKCIDPNEGLSRRWAKSMRRQTLIDPNEGLIRCPVKSARKGMSERFDA
jgi:hypothetical protein